MMYEVEETIRVIPVIRDQYEVEVKVETERNK